MSVECGYFVTVRNLESRALIGLRLNTTCYMVKMRVDNLQVKVATATTAA